MGNFVDFNQLEHMACNPSVVADYNDLVSSTSPAGQDMEVWDEQSNKKGRFTV